MKLIIGILVFILSALLNYIINLHLESNQGMIVVIVGGFVSGHLIASYFIEKS